ncbi:MAG TPA: type I glyceraldehyde-3-phosphate dehydrogenase [Thermoflexales bacterium]|nr:type I glyceraldehyde-3-phosphate dehydrogenase [Thermoflexales bacterium]HQW35747.1 type I glyceraldehyde-3-phosphate dehydrogenase [Thermoflexales bacterium]HQX76364.1 type I glyceraldehyde-3-phosphate dehydrogenase [Thermoflexales bacterium]HQZ22899.1 type I glyceraldehyde-3-phosphate dehydrogenase [Thermoflexales bacterium]HRA00603.1 type I glyceraldehyde-3-phosphate dehydrogenase [Thermoflexales bacterium]
MAKIKIGINGFGRIGRQVLKAMIERHADKFDVVAVNDLVDAPTNAHLFKYDSNYGRFHGKVEVDGTDIIINGDRLKVFAQRDPAAIPWGEVGADIVIESTGLFTDADKARAHLAGGAKKVIISAPAKKEDITIVMGVNEGKYDPAKHNVVSNASCTTNGLAPVAKVLFEKFGIEKGILTTVHAYTNSQKLLDLAAKDLRDARAAAMNIVPSETGAARAVGLVIPELQGKFGGMAFRVPTSTVSVVDFTAILGKSVTKEEINAAMKEYSEGAMKGILGYTEEPGVSMDFKGDERSSIFSAMDTLVVGGNLVKCVSWYDNEWGYSCRVGDLAAYMASKA